jgi:RES domain-containing protein
MRVRQLSSVFCRCVRDVFAPLDTTGALRAGGRFNPRGLAALYLAEDPDLAMRESAHPSAMDPSRSNIVVFPDNILEGSRVELVQQEG